ncbi:hypothetical protein PMIN03_002496 [Paraphaeosphaeria minitans]
MKQRGVQMDEGFKGKGSHVILGPVIGPLGRQPFGGRNWEGFSPEAYLSGVLVEETRNPSTVNGTEIDAISSNIDDKTMHGTYLWPFANAVKAGTASLMCRYNRINGPYGCQNSKNLNGLLKDELGFQGYVMSDWGAVHTGYAGIEAGLDMNMPGGISFTGGATSSFWGANISAAVTNGSLAIERVDDMILRVMTPYYHLGQDFGFPVVDESTVPLSFFSRADWRYNYTLGPIVDVCAQHAKLIRQLGAAGTVLLKNVNNTLPLKKPKRAPLGNDAADMTRGQYTLSISSGLASGDYDIGTLAARGGSGTGRFTYIIPPLDAIKTRVQSYGALVHYMTDNVAIAAGSLSSLSPTPLDACLVFLKSWASEGDDRTTIIAEWNSTVVVEAVASECANTIVVLHGASPDVLPWKDNVNVTAILAAHFQGQETGNSIVNVLWGDVNPSGRLPYTIANNEMDYDLKIVNSTELLESTNPNAWQDDFKEGNLIDYKEFDAANKSVAYEFGFGLSYTTFELSYLQIKSAVSNPSRVPSSSAKINPGGNEELWQTLVTVCATVKNMGALDGPAVP